jgi:hypothetical protein
MTKAINNEIKNAYFIFFEANLPIQFNNYFVLRKQK